MRGKNGEGPTWNAGSVCGDGSKFAPATSRKRADDRTKEDRNEAGAGPPDLWDSWSKRLGDVKTKTESRAHHHVPAVFDLVWRGE